MSGGRSTICTDAERLAAYADGRLVLPDCEELEAHLETCPACRTVLREVTLFAHGERERFVSPPANREQYQQAVDSLAVHERAMLLARYEDGLEFDAIARRFEMDVPTARALLARTVMKLRLLLARQ